MAEPVTTPPDGQHRTPLEGQQQQLPTTWKELQKLFESETDRRVIQD